MILWVRHGQSTWNLVDRMQGHEMSPPLTDLGRTQASAAADELVGRGAVRLISSPAVRARETADIIGDRLRLAVEAEPLLLEKGLDEEVVQVLGRVQQLMAADLPEHTVAVSHGDTIAIAVAMLSRTTPKLPPNGSITAVDPASGQVHVTDPAR